MARIKDRFDQMSGGILWWVEIGRFSGAPAFRLPECIYIEKPEREGGREGGRERERERERRRQRQRE